MSTRNMDDWIRLENFPILRKVKKHWKPSWLK